MRKQKGQGRAGAVFLAAALGALCLLAGCGAGEAASEAPLQVLTIGTADSGGTMCPVGRAVADVLNEHGAGLRVNTGASSGSVANVEALRTGQVDLALVSGDVAWCALQGEDEFAGAPAGELRAIGALYVSASHWMALQTTDARYVHDLLGSRVSIGPENSNTELAARTALAAVGLNDSNTIMQNQGLVISSGGEAVLNGEVDALHAFAGIPVSGLSELADQAPCRLLRFTRAELDSILAQNSLYTRVVIPAGTYTGQMTNVETFGTKCLLCVWADMDDALAADIARLLWENNQELQESHSSLSSVGDSTFFCSDLSIPLHSGAAQYYREAGLLEE